ncbi:Fic/DOC family protein [Paenibacillus sp. SGZ-1009]|uniref:Fic/DOC family protein n=1 Tax=Paenibacillus campi TaxID=3106031 RepID=UPI002AFEFD5C|nr:Fic family protein [Paenibacillus sp. SGZ-1009]
MSRYNDEQSRYYYPGTDVLKNKVNIRDAVALGAYELSMTLLRTSQLKEHPLAGKFDLKHLQSIHYHLFKDVYSFAGKLRTEGIAKDNFPFALPQYMQDEAQDLFRQLKAEKNLSGLPADKFAERAAHYMAEINVLHPFREGNGRTQREFIRCLAHFNGYALEWERTNPQQLLHASIRSVSNTDALTQQIHNCLVNKEPDPAIAQQYKTNAQALER